MTRDPADTIVVNICHPAEWFGDPTTFAEQVQALRDLDPRIEVVNEPFVVPRSARVPADQRSAPVELSASQAEAFGRAEIVLTLDLPDDLARVAPRLRWVQGIGAGGEHLLRQTANTQVRVTTSSGSNAIGIAEFVMARVLQHAKSLDEIGRLQHDHVWRPLYGRQVAGQTIALLGFGGINQAVASRAIAFGLRVLVVRRRPGGTPPGIDAVVGSDQLLTILEQSDIVVAAMPETPETIGMIGASEFAAMRAGAFFCNVGRGSLLDEAALIASLESGHLGGAAIDVTSIEPLPAEHPLWSAPRLQISSHCSSVPSAMFPETHRMFRENVVRYLHNEPLVNEIG